MNAAQRKTLAALRKRLRTPSWPALHETLDELAAAGDDEILGVLGEGLSLSPLGRIIIRPKSEVHHRIRAPLRRDAALLIARMCGLLDAATVLLLEKRDHLSELSLLDGLPALEKVSLLESARPLDLTALVSLPQLRRLSLAQNQPQPSRHPFDLSILTQLPKLESLTLHCFRTLTDLSVLADLPGLRTLKVWNADALTDLSGLKATPKLTELELQGLPALQDFSPLAGLGALTRLSLYRCPLTDPTILGSLPVLEVLELGGCALHDLSPLAALPELTNVTLVACSALIDVSPLTTLPKLTSLQLIRCESISDISSLTRAVSLETVNLTSSRQVTGDDVLRASGIAIQR